ncbi:MAG TPA: hypothetical protein VFV05_21270 [Methylomirabilota bacterium]|nr:hypothetical protein [Methylomirabilota bacterium]
MPFFELVREDRMAPELKPSVDRARKRARSEVLPPSYLAMAAHPPLLKSFVETLDGLIPVPNRFGAVQFIASMLIAHARGCAPCFNGSREFLLKIGFDESTLESMCQAPDALPLAERERRFVEFTLRVARDPGGIKPAHLREMERAGFAKDEILEMIGVAGFWALATTVTSALAAGLGED